jgi:Serine carboxypeptidase
MMGGPCYINDDANTTTLNPWSFNNEANVLYIDQPVQTGFSYDILLNGTLNQLEQGAGSTGYVPMDFSSGVPETNVTFLVGTFPSQLESQTANSSLQAAHALYHFMQAFVNEYDPPCFRWCCSC